MAPSFSRTQRKEALKHVLEHLLDEDPNDFIAKALSNSKTITITHHLPDARKERIRLLQGYVHWLHLKGTPVDNTLQGWRSLTRQAFCEYCLSPYSSTTTTPYVASPVCLHTQGKTVSDVDHFKWGVIRDISLFPVLHKVEDWRKWDESLSAIASALYLEDILDGNKVPTVSEVALDNKNQKFMFGVFQRCVQTDMGRYIVCQYESTKDARKIYRDLRAHALTSPAAKHKRCDILSYLANARLGDGKWKGTTDGFIFHWQEQLRDYEYMQDSSMHIHPKMKKTLLQNAVSLVPELNEVQEMAQQLLVYSGIDVTYENYCKALHSAAQTLDERLKKTSVRPQRQIHEVDLGYDFGHDTSYNIDTALYELEINHLEINQTHRGNPAARLPEEIWITLPRRERQIWNQLSSSTKAAILRAHTLSDSPPTPSSASRSGERSLNQHDRQPTDGTTGEGERSILAHMARGETPHPADLKRMLSKSYAKKPGNINKFRKEEIEINGRRHRAVNVTYRISQTLLYKPDTDLVHRGANGGIAGSNLRIIKTTGDVVNVEVIDNYQVTNVPVVSGGGLTKTNKGPVIAIFHQYAHMPTSKTIHSACQIEYYENEVDDRAKANGGLSRITTLDGYIISMSFRNGVPYIAMQPYTDKEFDELPHVTMTGENKWDPQVLDGEFVEDSEEWHDAVTSQEMMENFDLRFDDLGDY
ncbi:hypothetical protein IV203_003127 [Nitzschia inconspicua]|uniref:Uncharacterized protein n=1 Tax=Nitzschia inconspicua TaxID=303405 RepID=A0A9K3PND2_9STRA|nr:hypothetical protein IV203_003127 [Nitzschia inconspicua]